MTELLAGGAFAHFLKKFLFDRKSHLFCDILKRRRWPPRDSLVVNVGDRLIASPFIAAYLLNYEQSGAV